MLGFALRASVQNDKGDKIGKIDDIVVAPNGTLSIVVIEVGGVGYAVTLTPAHALTMRHGAEVFVRTAMIVREDEHLLFGFESTAE